MDFIDMSGRMIFIIGSPRSGSTLLERIVGSHPEILGGPEPHLLTPLAHLGYYETVEKAPYDHLRAVQAQRSFVAALPRGEDDYLDALRAYCHVLYGRMLEPTGKKFFLDKTPAYALVLPFITKVFPSAKYIVLTRHPAAIFSSYADSFFEGDWQAAHDFNPVIERYVPAIARFLRDKPVPYVHVCYEKVVSDPEEEVCRICEYLGVDFRPEMIEYGASEDRKRKGLGDPVGVNRHSRPVTSSVAKWVKHVAGFPDRESLLRRMIDACDPQDIDIWGYDPKTLLDPLKNASAASETKRKHPSLTAFRLERKILHLLRRNIHKNALGRMVKKIRFACDVLLR